MMACMALLSFAIATPAVSGDAAPGVAVERAGAVVAVLSARELAALPAVQLSAPLGKDHAQAAFEGPLLWSILERAGLIDPAKVRDQVRQTVVITGRDGYTAVLALGEISPEFAGKAVLLAPSADGQPLALEHVRLVVPGDKRGGRSVRDVVRISLN